MQLQPSLLLPSQLLLEMTRAQYPKPSPRLTILVPLLQLKPMQFCGLPSQQSKKDGHISLLKEMQSDVLTPCPLKMLFQTGLLLNLVCSILNLKVGFVQCCFCWVKRESNYATHVIAKLSLTTSESFCFNKDNLPSCPLCLFGRLSLCTFHMNKS